MVVPAGFADGLAVEGTSVGDADRGGVADGVDEALGGDAGLPVGVDSGAEAVPQPATSRLSTTARLLMRQVWVRSLQPHRQISNIAAPDQA